MRLTLNVRGKIAINQVKWPFALRRRGKRFALYDVSPKRPGCVSQGALQVEINISERSFAGCSGESNDALAVDRNYARVLSRAGRALSLAGT